MNEIYQKLKSYNKIDLHIHLNGLFDSELIQEILINEGTLIPTYFNPKCDLNILNYKRNLERYLRPWDVLRLMPCKYENLVLLIDNAFKKLSDDNVRAVELRSSIVYLSLLQNMNLENTLIMFISALNEASNKYKVKYGLIMTISRGEYSFVHFNSLISAFNSIGKPIEIIGLDLAGNENYPISKELSKSFRSSKDQYGFMLTVHAGETGSVDNIREAINDFHADRIGHGTAAGKCEKTMELLSKKDICVEVCPISNRRTGAVKANEAHPVKRFIQNNVPFVICSDNPSIHKTTLTDDYYDFYKETNELKILDDMLSKQIKYSFIKKQ